jgi:hypothetical protein
MYLIKEVPLTIIIFMVFLLHGLGRDITQTFLKYKFYLDVFVIVFAGFVTSEGAMFLMWAIT